MQNKSIKIMVDISAFLLSGMALLVIIQVITRYVFVAPPPWTEEIARYFMIWATLIGAAVLMFEKNHINLSYFIDNIPYAHARFVRIFVSLILILFLIYFIQSGFELIENSLLIAQVAPGSRLPMFIVYLIVPISGFLMLVAQLVHLYNEIKGYK